MSSVKLPNGKLIQYIFDGQNRRIGKKINGTLQEGYIYQGQNQIVAETDGSGKILETFVYGSKPNSPDYMIQNGHEYRIISDQVGTPKMLVDADRGRVVERYDFDEFGVQSKTYEKSMLPFGFAGGLYDQDTGLVHFGARDYDPVTGRWTSKDPILFNGGDTNLYGYVGAVGKPSIFDTNLYQYTFSDPVNYIDPKGEQGMPRIAPFGGGATPSAPESYPSVGQCLSSTPGQVINYIGGELVGACAFAGPGAGICGISVSGIFAVTQGINVLTCTHRPQPKCK